MEKLFQSKVYKRSFIIYIVALFSVFAIIFVILSKSILDSGLLNYEYRAADCYEYTEERLDSIISEIDEYVLQMYSDTILMKDFLCFWGRDAGDYITERLKNTYYNEEKKSFLDDFQNFIMNTDYHIRQVFFYSPNGINALYINDQGTTSYRFFIDQEEYDQEIGTSENGFCYIKSLRQPDNMSKLLGTVAFLIDNDYIYNSNVSGFEKMIIYRQSKEDLAYDVMAGKPAVIQVNETKDSDMNQPQKFKFFTKQYEFRYDSERHTYGMILKLTRKQLAAGNRLALLWTFCSVLGAYLVMCLLISSHMRKEAKFLGKIIQSIQCAHNGDFKQIFLEGRKDEYAMIAREFNLMAKELEAYIKKEYMLKIKQQDAEMKALIYQINPHFLYNTLETIKSCAIQHQDEAVADALLYLGKTYRMLVKEDDVISMQKEIEMLECYLKIMEFKYDDKFCYQIDMDEELMELRTIKFWLQPLVENAFEHGFDEESEFNLLILRGRRLKDTAVIELIDNGCGVSKEQLEQMNALVVADACQEDVAIQESHEVRKKNTLGVGVLNVSARLRYFYGEHCCVSFQNGAVKGLTVKIQIPYQV